MEVSENFLLRVANQLLEEVRDNTEVVLLQAQDLKNRASGQSFWNRLNSISAATGLVNELKNNLTIAWNLCKRVCQVNPSAELEGGVTVKHIQSAIRFQFGLIYSMEKNFKQAVSEYEESLSLMPDQATYFNLGLCLLNSKGLFTDKTSEAITAFQKCIEIDPNTDTAIKAGMELARLGKL